MEKNQFKIFLGIIENLGRGGISILRNGYDIWKGVSRGIRSGGAVTTAVVLALAGSLALGMAMGLPMVIDGCSFVYFFFLELAAVSLRTSAAAVLAGGYIGAGGVVIMGCISLLLVLCNML